VGIRIQRQVERRVLFDVVATGEDASPILVLESYALHTFNDEPGRMPPHGERNG